MCNMDFPGSSSGKESACNAGDPGSIPGSERFPGEGNGYPLETPMDCKEIKPVNPKGNQPGTWKD